MVTRRPAGYRTTYITSVSEGKNVSPAGGGQRESDVFVGLKSQLLCENAPGERETEGHRLFFLLPPFWCK